jgi:hypothetical protein
MRDTSDLAQRTALLSRRSLTKLAITMGAAGASTALQFSGAGAQAADGPRMMLVTTTVEDFERFIKVFDGPSLPKRKQYGSTGATMFHDPFDKSRVWVVFEWDEKGWQNFVSDPEVPPILKTAGHTSGATAAQPAGRFAA